MGRVEPAILAQALRALLLVLCANFFAVPATAQQGPGFAKGSTCWTSGARTLRYADLAAQPAQWTCAGDSYDWKQPRHFVRLDLRGKDINANAARYAEFDRHEFERLTVTLIGADGNRASRSYDFDETWLGRSSLHSMVEFPEFPGKVEAVLFTLDGGDWPESLARADLVAKPSVPPTSGFVHLVAALICGLLLAPILFDLGYFRALREPFPLWHALFCSMAFVQTAAVSGLIPLLTPIGFEAELFITYMSLDVMVAATMLFASNFVEPEFIARRQRVALFSIALLALLNGALTTFLPELFGEWIDHVYFGAYMLMLGVYFAVLWQARRAGSRMAAYLILGFAPFCSIIAVQFVGVVSDAGHTFDETWPQNFALLFEVVATALAVADRFIAIKRERDQAIDDARILEKLSERDELTGLRNRRSLDAQFADLVADGFHTVAVLDIDHFKPINDLYGHPFGDAVLVSAAAALRAGDDENLLAFRIGGEEFLLMLRGQDAGARAETRRRAITARTLSDMEGLDRPVTASMGVLDFSAVADEPELDFWTLYTRADQLLYDAKCAGRNRTRSDTLDWFVPEAAEGQTAAA